MKLSDAAKAELIKQIPLKDFERLQKRIFAANPGSKEAMKQFTDLLRFFHEMSGHPVRRSKPIKGKFLL